MDLGDRRVTLRGAIRLFVVFVTPPGARSAEVLELRIEADRPLDDAGTEQIVKRRSGPAAEEAGPGLGWLLTRLMDHLADVEVEAYACADADVCLRFGGGLDVWLPGGQQLTMHGATRGPVDAARLSSPWVVSVPGAAVRASHAQLRWVSALAKVRVDRATLHPDGSVHLEGRGRGGLDRVVRGGLQQASARLSGLVRTSPRFASVRAFLPPA